MPDLVVDTDILIDVGRRIPEAITYVQTQEQHYQLLISTITALELMIGARKSNYGRLSDSSNGLL
jgi:predicted nucleic acid-binding protein